MNKSIIAAVFTCCATPAMGGLDKDRAAEKAAVPSASHPYAGFWKEGGCANNFGVAIAPAGDSRYSISFCGPGGCFEPGTYRPNTTLSGDPNYRIVDDNNIELRTITGYSKYVRCPKR